MKTYQEQSQIITEFNLEPEAGNGELAGPPHREGDIEAQEQLTRSRLAASLEEMAASIAQQVNNPLGSVLLHSAMLMAQDNPPETKRDLKVIHDEARRAVQAVTDLLIKSRRRRPEKRRVELQALLREVLAAHEPVLSAEDIAVTTCFGDGPLLTTGDPTQLRELFSNLVVNAAEALRGQGNGRIAITMRRSRGRVAVSVADNGPGIPSENLERVFHPFFSTKRPGAGLGLSTCHGIATGHSGSIRAQNNALGGATFTVELPLTRSRGEPARRAPRECPVARQNQNGRGEGYEH
jgi:signal transduction histidine kinase